MSHEGRLESVEETNSEKMNEMQSMHVLCDES